MKKRLLRINILLLPVLFNLSIAHAATYDWIGVVAATPTKTSVAGNWFNRSTGFIATAAPGAGDDVQIGVNTTYGLNSISLTAANMPAVDVTATWKSLTFGYSGTTQTTYTYGKLENISLSVNTGTTLTVNGNITQNHNSTVLSGNSFNYNITTIQGAGTLKCLGAFNVGNILGPSSADVATVSQVSIQINQLTISGNILLTATGANPGGICYPYFSLEKGTTTLMGKITFATTLGPLASRYDILNSSPSPGQTMYQGYGLFTAGRASGVGSPGATGTGPCTLELQNVAPITPADLFYVYFNFGGENSTVLYDDPNTADNQKIYTANEPSSPTTTASYINTTLPAGITTTASANYCNITFSGASTKVVDANSTITGSPVQGLTAGGQWTTNGTGNANLTTNNPTVTVTGNWTNSTTVTTDSKNITVGSLTNSAIINQGTGNIAMGGSLINNSGGTLNLSSGSLSIGGDYTNNIGGAYNQGTGTIFFTGTGAQALVDHTTTGTTFKKVTFNGGGTATMSAGTNNVNFILASTGVLTLLNNSNLVAGTIATAGGPAYLTLNSDVNNTASVAPITGTSKLSGNVKVLRCFAGGPVATTRNYRSLSSAVNNGAGGFDLNYLKTVPGLFTGGPGGAASGFTYNNPTPYLYLYQESVTPSNSTFNGGNFKGLVNINTGTIAYYSSNGVTVPLATLPVGNAFLLYYSGDNVNNLVGKETRIGGVYANPESATSTATGFLNQGSVPVKLWWNGSTTLSYTTTGSKGFNLVGNPYASTIDWDTYSIAPASGISGTGIVASTIYVFNYSSRNYGAYSVGLTGGKGTNNSSRYIASGQGFFIRVGTGGGALTFNESAKSTVQPNSLGAPYLLMGLPKATAKTQSLKIRLANDTINTDETIVLFEQNANNGYEPQLDALRLNGIGNISSLGSYSSKSDTMLSINHMHSIDSTTRIKMYVSVSSPAATDTLTGSGFETLDPRYDAFLIDHYKKDSVAFSKSPQYQFNISNADTSSFGANRFEVIFHKDSAFAYRLVSFTAKAVQDGVQLNWKTQNEQNLTGFAIQRQDGSKQFIPLYSLQSDGTGNYTYLDKYPVKGINYYRLQQDDPFDVTIYSNVLSVDFNSLSNLSGDAITLYPSPASSQLNVKINMDVPSRMNLQVISAAGRVLISRQASGNNIQLPVGNLMPGSYLVEVSNSSTQKVIGLKKFIKR